MGKATVSLDTLKEFAELLENGGYHVTCMEEFDNTFSIYVVNKDDIRDLRIFNLDIISDTAPVRSTGNYPNEKSALPA